MQIQAPSANGELNLPLVPSTQAFPKERTGGLLKADRRNLAALYSVEVRGRVRNDNNLR
jgi:hypothetical protein